MIFGQEYMVRHLELVILVLLLAARFLREMRAQHRRFHKQKYLRYEQLLPGNYKAFTQVENQLLTATCEQNRSSDWTNRELHVGPKESQIVSNYVDGLREDFLRADRILGNFVIHSPGVMTGLRWELERMSMELSYYYWYVRVWYGLRARTVVPKCLGHLTETVKTIAYRTRKRLKWFERTRSLEFVEAILRKC